MHSTLSKWMTSVSALCVLFAAVAACSSSSDSGSNGAAVGTSSGGSSAGGSTGGLACAPAGADGSSACGSFLCDENEHCDKQSCLPGCVSSANCAAGMGCDFSGATNGVGVCNKVACGAVGAGGSTGMNCPSVAGAYKLSLDVAKSSAACKSAFSGDNACSITQTGCKVSWACSGAGFSDLTLDADGAGTTTVPTPAGTANCNVKFYTTGVTQLSFDCSLNVSGQAVVCSGKGY